VRQELNMDFKKLIDTTDPDNSLGPLLLAIIISALVALVTIGIGRSHL
jgi:hypothetical protein